MHNELSLWRFVRERLERGENVMLLVVAESSGSSPGRQGYKMVVGADGELFGSIGGGVMEVNLVERSRNIVSGVDLTTTEFPVPHSALTEQVHRKESPHASGMICSGKQTVIFKLLTPEDKDVVRSIIDALQERRRDVLRISPADFSVGPIEDTNGDFSFDRSSDPDFLFTEVLGFKNYLFIVGGGHCALALSEIMSKLDFHISIFDDRPQLNTVDKNRFAHEITIIDSYEEIGRRIPERDNAYVVVMTLGYRSDDQVIRALLDREFKYFGVLGSNAKMKVMLKKLRDDGIASERLERIHTPIGLRINSRTPEEIAISIAAEIISVKNR